MLELLLVFVGGALGSSHCLGMCGGFALAIGAGASSAAVNLRRQLVYSLGRIFTYSAAGAVVGYGGWRLAQQAASVVQVQAVLAIAAGLLLVVQGLLAAGALPRRRVGAPQAPCLAGGLLGSYLASPGTINVFTAGILTGFLPCGLVYAYLALASASGDMWGGMARMAVFGLGTVPLMVLAGCGGPALNLLARRRVLRVAAWCVVLAGVVSLVRGIGFLSLSGPQTASCPFCP